MREAIYKDIARGVGLAVLATYLITALLVAIEPQNWARSISGTLLDMFVNAPVFVLCVTFWLVLPLGAGLGAVIPYVARRCNPQAAICYGMALGILAGCICAIILAYMGTSIETAFNSSKQYSDAQWWAIFWGGFARAAFLMSLYSMVWTSAYAYILARRFHEQNVVQHQS